MNLLRPLRTLRVGLFFFVLGAVCVLVLTQPILGDTFSRQIHIESDPPFFSPNQMTIPWKTSLAWINQTHEAHSIVADDCRTRSECPFDSGIIRPDHEFVLSELAPGHYPYHCGLHPFMRGLLIIHQQKPNISDI